MKIVELSEITTNRGKAELNSAESWLFSKEGKKTRLGILQNLEEGKAAVVELREFGTNKKKANGLDDYLNRVFVLGEIPLKATAKSDTVIIKKLDKFDADSFSERVKQIGLTHAEFIKSKLAEITS